jgi:hypothetical protein
MPRATPELITGRSLIRDRKRNSAAWAARTSAVAYVAPNFYKRNTKRLANRNLIAPTASSTNSGCSVLEKSPYTVTLS